MSLLRVGGQQGARPGAERVHQERFVLERDPRDPQDQEPGGAVGVLKGQVG